MLKLRLLSTFILVVLVTGCGGGGGDTSSIDNNDNTQMSVVTASVVQLGAIIPTSNITLDASASSDSLNGNLTYSWQQTSGPSVDIVNTSEVIANFITPNALNDEQTLTFQVTVASATDSDTATVTATIAALVDNPTSVVIASVVQLDEIEPSSNVRLDASASSDSLNGSLTYSWQQTSGPSVDIVNTDEVIANFITPNALNDEQTLTFQVTVASATDSDTVTVTATIAALVDNPTSVVIASVVQLDEIEPSSNVMLDASASSDSLNGSLTYSWQQTSGPSVDIVNTSEVIANFITPNALNEQQTLTFQVTVASATDSDTATVTATITALVTNQTNILFIISDDQGLDASAQYSYSTDLPITPTINALAEGGIVFNNAWATPACTTTRGTIITGKYGVNSGVTYVPAVLTSDTSEQEVLQEYLKNNSASANYNSALFGKWHLGGGGNTVESSHPNDVGINHYAGNLDNIDDYDNWTLTINGTQETSTEYHTSKITDLAIDWITVQSNPWFAWVAYSAPHAPFHLPPLDLHARDDLTGDADHIAANQRDYYLAAIEAMDTEINRLLASMDTATRENTIIIYLGDNGTPRPVIDNATYQNDHAKGSLYQGGVAVPLVISGKGVTRIGEREVALVTATDLYATIGQLAGISNSKVHDSNSFVELLSNNTANSEDYLFTAFESTNITGWAVRSEGYKLITYEDNTQELYDLTSSFSEVSNDNLLPSTDNVINTRVSDFTTFANNITGENNDSPIDITNVILSNGSGNCAEYIERFTSTVNDVNNSIVYMGDFSISVIGDKCIFNTNEIPNHDFNDGAQKFPNDVSEQDSEFQITTTPTKAANSTELSLQVDNALLLNGVKVDLLAGACYGVGGGTLGEEKIGCGGGNDWRYNPMFINSGFNVDSHNAHSQGDGTYHYHGSPLALFSDSSNSSISPVIGFAADGFPIFGSYFNDNGTIRKALSSYQLKIGTRPTAASEPGEAGGPFAGDSYDGRFKDDYEHILNTGDLDECNGMTIDGIYGYYVTDDFPYVLGCFSGTPDDSFHK